MPLRQAQTTYRKPPIPPYQATSDSFPNPPYIGAHQTFPCPYGQVMMATPLTNSLPMLYYSYYPPNSSNQYPSQPTPVPTISQFQAYFNAPL